MDEKKEIIELPEWYFNFQVFWLRKMGTELLQEESYAYRIYSYCAFTFILMVICQECAELAMHTDFNMLVMVFNMSIAHLADLIVVIVVKQNRKRIGALMKSLHEGLYKPNDDRGGPFEKRCVKKALRSITVLMLMYGLPICSVFVFGVLIALKTRLTEPPEMWKLPFTPISFGKIADTSPYYEIAFVYEIIGVFMTTMSIFASDSTMIALIGHVTCQLQILGNSIRTYHEQDVRRQVNETEPTERAYTISKSLKDNIIYHCNILDTAELMEYLCSIATLFRFLACIILLCLLMYATSIFGLFSLGFILYLSFSILIGSQVFIYCWSGNEMTLAYEALALAAAECYNPDNPRSDAIALKLIIMRTQRPLYLTVGKFSPLSIQTFTSVVKGSFSYFMVVRQMSAENSQ